MSAAESTGVSDAVGGSVRDPAGAPGPNSAGSRRSHGTLGASWRLLRSEMRLILGRRRNRAGILVLAALPVLLAIALRASDPSEGEGGPDLISAATSNGVFVALTALTAEMALFLPLAVAVLAGDTIAGEANLGTLRYLLTVPVGRARLLVVKYVSLVVGALIGAVVVAATGIIVGGALLGLGPTTLLSGNQISLAEALGRVALAVLYVTAGLAGLAAIGLFISTLTEQPIAAMVTVTIISSAMWIMDGIPQLHWLAPWLLVHRWSAFVDLFRDPIFWDVMRTGLLVDLGYIVVFLALAWARFANKDVTS
jgi:ABC-2 type transport system permease protein